MSVLYQTIRMILINTTNNLATMNAFKSKYTAEFIDTMTAELNAAEAMAGEQARAAEHEMLRVTMTEQGAACRQNWQFLKRYIADAYAPSMHEIQWDAAGWAYYTEASNNNWDKLREMMNMGSQFIAANETALKDLGFMPDAFVTSFNASMNTFNATYDSFLTARENAFQGTADKIAANNAVYERTISICEDGQTVFADDETRKSLFSFTAVSELVSPRGASTLIITVTNAETEMPLAGAEVHVNGTDRTVITDSDGRAEIGNLSAGTASGTIIRDGYADATFSTTLTTGTTTRIESAMSALIASPGPEPVVTPEPVEA